MGDKYDPYTVYVLRDPRDKQVRYVGVTRQPLNKRLSEHIGDHGHSMKHRWLKELKSAGVRPIIEQVEVIESHRNEHDVERAYIALFVSVGCRLTNKEYRYLSNKKYPTWQEYSDNRKTSLGLFSSLNV